MLAILSLLLAVLSSSLAAPFEIVPRAGPSGQLISPAGGVVISQEVGVLQFVYQPVTFATNPGYATQYVNLFIWDQDTDVTTPLAIGLVSDDEEEDAEVSGLIMANFTFSTSAFCGGSYQLVVYEYQTGSLAPTDGFQSAAPYFSIIDCEILDVIPDGTDHGTWNSPTEGATIGDRRDSVFISYVPEREEQFTSYFMNLDIQQNTASIDDPTAWTPVASYISTLFIPAGSAYFASWHWGHDKLRVTSIGMFSGVWFSATNIINVTLVDTYRGVVAGSL